MSVVYLPKEPYLPASRGSARMFVSWCRDINGPAHDYFEVYRYKGFIRYVLIQDPDNLTADEIEKISQAQYLETTEDKSTYIGTEEELFIGCTPMRKFLSENVTYIGATENTYFVDSDTEIDEYYSYMVAGINNQYGDPEEALPFGDEPHQWYRKLSDLNVCCLNSLSAEDLTTTPGQAYANLDWRPSQFCNLPQYRFSNKPYEEPPQYYVPA